MNVLFAIVIILLAFVLVAYHVKIVSQSDAYVVERLGTYKATWKAGLHILAPFIDSVKEKVTLKEQVSDFEPQPVITKDNVTMMIDTVVYFVITDPKLYTYGIDYPIDAIENLTATTLRNIIGNLELDETLTSRETINTQMREVLDDATDPWGIKITRVELKNIMPPKDIQNAMEQQMRAEREKRAKILTAEGEKQSAILLAEGDKESTVIRAQAEKEATINKAEGQAQAMERLYEARAKGVEMINGANPSKEYLALQGFDTLQKVADGQATKLIIPSDLQDIAGTLAALSETVKKD